MQASDARPGSERPGPDESDLRELTLMVRELARGASEAGVALMPHLLRELKAIAQGHLRHQRAGHTLQATALVNEAYLKLFHRGGLEINDRKHFFALASTAIRQVLVDHARRRRDVQQIEDPARVSIRAQGTERDGEAEVDVLELHEALEQLGRLDERQARIVELHYFGGLRIEEIGELLELSRRSVQRELRAARAWLGRRIEGGGGT